MNGFRWKGRLAAAFIIMIFLASAVQALEADEISIQSNPDWLTAGETASIQVVVNNLSVTVNSVEFSVLETGSSGTVTPAVDTGSPWKTDFYSEESGVADIQVTVRYTADGSSASLSKVFEQKIDHAPMYSFGPIEYENEVTVNEVVPIIVCAFDKYGNLVDSRKENATGGTPEYFEFNSQPETSEFWDGSAYSTNYAKIYVNSSGYAEALFRVSEFAGSNSVNIDPSGAVSYEVLTIDSLANAEPANIIAVVNPASGDPPYLPADGISKFYLTYQLTDMWGNPSAGRQVYISPSNPGESGFYRTSNASGRIAISYGPQVIKGIYTLSASCVDNMSVSDVTDLEFVSTAPTDMLLTANPQVMPSHDVNTGFKSDVRAKVIDERGNPVKGETVTFSIIPGAYPLSQVADPYLEATSAESNQNGQAVVKFVPGEFETDWDSANFSNTASAACQVLAEWNGTYRLIDLEWKNYPYLSVRVNVTPETVKVNDTIKVTIQLIGDGWALQPDPIDTMMVADRSLSMLTDDTDRLVSLMEAMKLFNAEMAEGRDQVGLITFAKGTGIADTDNDLLGDDDNRDAWGHYYNDDATYKATHYKGAGVTDYGYGYATLDQEFTTDHDLFDDKVDYIFVDMWTPLRWGVYEGITYVDDNAREDAVKAVVVLTDGQYNYFGDPLARGSPTTSEYLSHWFSTNPLYEYTTIDGLDAAEQDLSFYASSKGIKLYTIAFGNEITESDSDNTYYTLKLLAQSTGGEVYYAEDGDELKEVYKEIAGELQVAAGVDTEMELMFQNVEINNVTVPNSGSTAVLEYVYDPEDSTHIENFYDNGTHTSVIEDQTEWWSENKSLNFDVGTVYLNQTWQTTFMLKVLKPGNINLFNDTSFISFNGGEDILNLPDTWFTAVEDLNSTGVNFSTLEVSGFDVTNSGNITSTIDLEWTLYYTGPYEATQVLEYQRYNDGWIVFAVMPELSGPVDPAVAQQTQLFINDFLPGDYDIRITASAVDTADSVAYISDKIPLGDSASAYIKIE